MDWGEFFKQTGIVVVAVLAAIAALLAWIERLMKVRELQRRLEQLEHERKQRISRIQLPTDEEVRRYSMRYLFASHDFIGPSIENVARDMRMWAVMPLRHAADMIDGPRIGSLTVEVVRSDFAAIFTALEHFEVIAQTGLASNEQFRTIVAHTWKVLREMGSEGVAMLDASVGIPVASRFLGHAESEESVELPTDLRD